MMDRYQTFKDYRATVPLLSQKISDLYTIPYRFYGSPNPQNQMCKLYASDFEHFEKCISYMQLTICYEI